MTDSPEAEGESGEAPRYTGVTCIDTPQARVELVAGCWRFHYRKGPGEGPDSARWPPSNED